MRVGSYPGIEPRLIGEATSSQSYRGRGVDGGALLDAIERAGLRGRGGAGFPTATKCRTVAASPGPRYLLANGEEGEPASLKDRYLLRRRPHLMLDGLLRVARAVAVERAFVYVSDPVAADRVASAIRELPSSASEIECVTVEPGYVAGEETAAVRAVNEGLAKPTAKPPRPFEGGIDGRPTLVLNVETLANVPFIACHGPAAYRQAGEGATPGTVLLTLSGACRKPGLYEVPFGISLRDAIETMAGGTRGEPRGFLVGGFFSGLVGPRALDLTLAYGLGERELALGCGAIVVLGPDDCPVGAASDVMAFFARENAKQCGACVRGTAAMAEALERLAAGEGAADDVERLRTWATTLPGRGACALLDGAATLAGSLVRELPGEVESHLTAACERCRRYAQEAGVRSRFALAWPRQLEFS